MAGPTGRGRRPRATRHRGRRPRRSRPSRPSTSRERDPPDAPLAEPVQGAGHVLDLAQPERGPAVVGAAVPAEVEPEHAGGPPQRRPSATRSGATDPVHPWRSRIASYGSGTHGPASPVPAGRWPGRPRRIQGRQPARVQPQPVARPEPDDLPAERVEVRLQRLLIRSEPRRVEDARRGAGHHWPEAGAPDPRPADGAGPPAAPPPPTAPAAADPLLGPAVIPCST